MFERTRWFKHDWDKLWLVYTQIIPVIFELPCILRSYASAIQPAALSLYQTTHHKSYLNWSYMPFEHKDLTPHLKY
jgi:hypothetical protein